MKRWLLALAACGQPVAPPVAKPAVVAAAPADAGVATEEERLAAIQKAMNDLKGAAQQCWAQIATERFDVEGSLDASIDILERAGSPSATVTIANDSTHSPKLAACMQRVLSIYAWAPPLRGQSIRLPFKWTAPDGQNVITRALVPWTYQGKIGISVLLDENNTGNGAASMFEVGIEPGTTTGMRRADRAELWYFQSWKPDESNELDVVVSGGKLAPEHVVAGDMMFVPAGATREIAVIRSDKYRSALRAVLVMVPGGREGAARGGALPTPEATTGKGTPVVIHGKTVKQTGIASIYVDGTVIKDAPLAASIIHFAADANVPEHVHAHETELLYTWSHFGADTDVGTLTVAGVSQVVTDGSVIQIPPNTKHSYTGKYESFALQIYTPAGPEQRFKK